VCDGGPFPSAPAVDEHMEKCPVLGLFTPQSQPQEQRVSPRPPPPPPPPPPPKDVDNDAIGVDDEPVRQAPRRPRPPTPAGQHLSRWARWTGEEGADGCARQEEMQAEGGRPSVAHAAVVHVDDDDDDDVDDVKMPTVQRSRAGTVGAVDVVSDDEAEPELSAAEVCARMRTDSLLDFALGIGQPYAPDGQLAALSHAKRAPLRPEDVTGLPDLPKDTEPSNEESMRQVAARVRLWRPGGAALNAPFATSAARLGLTPDEFMAALMADCARDGDSFVLSDEARRMFAAAGAPKRPAAVDKIVAGSKRPRPWHRAAVECSSRSPPRPRRHAPLSPPASRSRPCPAEEPASPPRATARADGARLQSPCPPRPKIGRATVAAHVPAARRPAPSPARPSPAPSPPAPQPTPPSLPVQVDEVEAESAAVVPDSTTCPLCELVVPRPEIDSHLAVCLDVCDSPTAAGTTDKGEPAATQRAPGGDVTACPICGSPVPRHDLDAHVQACMATSGLVGEFG
jgi:hypothetical protein